MATGAGDGAGQGRRKRRASSIDVAREAGVSQSAVSRALSPGGSVSEATRRKVLEAASRLGYNGNAFARTLITQRSNLIGVVMGDIANPFYPEVLRLFTSRLQELGQRVLLFTVEQGHDVDEALPALLQYQIDGVLIASAFLSSQMAAACAKRSTPVVLFNRTVRSDHVACVSCDNVEGGRVAANLLADAGHVRPAFIAGIEDTSTSQDREKGFLGRLEERGYADVSRGVGHYTYEGGYDAALRLLTRADRPDAIFCANDIMALGALDAARRELGLRVPEEVAVIGFDDIPAAAWHGYHLSTIRQGRRRMVEVAVEILLAGIREGRTAPAIRLVPGDLVLRGTTRPVPLDAES